MIPTAEGEFLSGEGPSRRYEIVEPLKTGGSAEVFLGLMRGENGFVREVVIKRPRAHLAAEPRFRAMFVDEAHIASRLAHPNIVQVIDLVANPTEVYLVLEYLSGRDLRELLRRCFDTGRLPPLDVSLYIAAESAAGLDYAHRATASDGTPLQIVHRDVSPKNIRLTDAGAVKVIDFGIAHAEQRITETAPGSVKGTPGYMAPEQALGEPLDRRSDIFSLGICLFQMLTGRNPFDAPELRDRMNLLLKAPVPLVSSFRPGLPPELDEIVARSIARDPNERYSTAAELGLALEQVLHGLGTASPRARLVEVLESMFPDLRSESPELRSARTTSRGDTPSLPGWGDAETGALANTHVPDTELRAPKALGTSAATRVVSTSTGPAASARRSWPGLLAGAGLLAALGVVGVVQLTRGAEEVRFEPLTPGGVAAGVSTVSTSTGSARPVSQEVTARDAGVGTRPPRTKLGTPPKPNSEPSAKALFEAAVHLGRQGQHEDARFVYELILASRGGRSNPSVLKNLALAHRALGDVDRMQACFRSYLELRPDGADAPRIREMLEAGGGGSPGPCLSPSEARAVRMRAERVGARLDAWVEDARK